MDSYTLMWWIWSLCKHTIIYIGPQITKHSNTIWFLYAISYRYLPIWNSRVWWAGYTSSGSISLIRIIQANHGSNPIHIPQKYFSICYYIFNWTLKGLYSISRPFMNLLWTQEVSARKVGCPILRGLCSSLMHRRA